MLTARIDAKVAAKAAQKAHQDVLQACRGKNLKAEENHVLNQTSSGKIGLSYVMDKAAKKKIAAARETLSRRLSTQANRKKFSKFIMNKKTKITKATIRELKGGEKLSLSAFLPA